MRRGWLAVLAVAAAFAVALGWFRAQPAPAAARPVGPTAAAGVTLGGVDVTGWTAADLRSYLAAASPVTTPVDARVDPATQGLVPGLDGVTVDADATVDRVLSAPAGTPVVPVLGLVAPARGLADLPPGPVYRGNGAKHAVAFLINVAWGEQYVSPLLSELRGAHAAATFCLVGAWAEGHADLVRQMAADGFDFCNHGNTDHSWAGIGQAAAERSIRRADAAIASLVGRRPTLFSPHKGDFNRAVLAAVAATGHTLVLWSRDTIDWQNPPVYRVLERTAGRARPGDIVLMHPTAVTVQALPAMIRAIRDKGLRILSVSDLLSSNPWAGTAG